MLFATAYPSWPLTPSGGSTKLDNVFGWGSGQDKG